MKLVPVYPPRDVRPVEGEDPVVQPDGAKFEGFCGPNDERYERCTKPDGRVQWYALFTEQVLIDTRWFNLEEVTALYHPACASRIVTYLKMKPAEAEARYQPYKGTLSLSTKCDFCRKPVLFEPVATAKAGG